ncbi:MAG: FtsQ-type POTRA domain-containing protein [Pontimonas sp.]|nr:FtsQ-type POTRA domain-containing protein [Pontimonas sp.]
MKAATKQRVSAEKAEYRRFTQATRRRRITWAVSLGSVGLLMVSVVVLTLSPLLAFREVRVEGGDRVTSQAVADALSSLYGEPLARVNDERVQTALEPLTLVQAFETRIEPPGTLVVTIIERKPLGAVLAGETFDVVDAAGVTLWEEPTLPSGLPRILVGADPQSPSFSAITRVLRALPDELLLQIEGITATTLDDVRFTIRGSSHEVVWGSSERSPEKARVLKAALIAVDSEESKVIDVTTPDSVVVRARG